MDSPFSQINSYIQSLPRSKGSFDSILIARLVVAAVLLAVALTVDMLTVFKTILLILSALIAGYDVILDAVDAVFERDYFAAPILLVLIAVLSFVIGYGWEGALSIILYQLGIAAVGYAVNRTKQSAQDILPRNDMELTAKASVVIEDARAGETCMQREIAKAVSPVLKGIVVLAVLFAVVMPLATSLSVREAIHRALMIFAFASPLSVLVSIPLTGIIGLSYSANFGTLFNHAKVLEKLQKIHTVIIDKNGVFADNQPVFVGVKSDILDEKTFMEFVAHAVYYSDQAFAKAILSAEDREYRLDLISDFKDIPGSGVDVKIGGSPVTLAKRELLTDRGEAVPYEGKEGNTIYYLMVAGKYIGKVLFAESLNKNNANLINKLKSVGIHNSILLTEDSKEDSERIGLSLNADEVYSEFNDETKLRYLESLNDSDTMYVYANSLETHSNAAVDVRVSKKGKYADAIVTPEKLEEFPTTFLVSARMKQVASENAIFAVLVKAVLLFLAITGHCTVWFAVFLDFTAALATILNAIRVTKNPLIDIPVK